MEVVDCGERKEHELGSDLWKWLPVSRDSFLWTAKSLFTNRKTFLYISA